MSSILKPYFVALLIAGFACRTATAQDKALHIRVSLGDVSLNKVAFLIADDAGIYKKNGLDVDQSITAAATEAVRRNGVTVPPGYIRSGDAAPPDITIGGGIPAIVGMIANPRAGARVILATTDDEARWKVIARPGISRVDQLKGKRLGYSAHGTVSHFMLIAFIKQLGWDPDRDVSLVSGGLSFEALSDGLVDAFVADEIAEAMAAGAGLKPVVDLRQYHIPMAGSGVTASREWLEKNREAAARFMRSTVDAIAVLKQDREVASASLAKWFGITDPGKQQAILAPAASLPRKPYPSVAGIRQLMQIYKSPEMAKHKPEDFYDDSFVRQLDESGYIDRLYPPARAVK
jgi:NitT/TauT family transport system substrate-binding protein